jgi:hypothetical protein
MLIKECPYSTSHHEASSKPHDSDMGWHACDLSDVLLIDCGRTQPRGGVLRTVHSVTTIACVGH